MNDRQQKWSDLIAALGVVARNTDVKKVNLQTGLGFGVALLPFLLPFLSRGQQATAAIVASAATSFVAAVTDTRKQRL